MKEYVYESVKRGPIEMNGIVGQDLCAGLSVVHEQLKLHLHLCPR